MKILYVRGCVILSANVPIDMNSTSEVGSIQIQRTVKLSIEWPTYLYNILVP